MSLAPGVRVGVYEVVALLGAGGMGEVYRARDTRLNRDVAIKILPDAFAADADRVARFEREAQVLASLNHPNIGHIYGLEEAGSSRALVLELVDGPTLADRIAQGPIPLDEALPIARQIAEALDAAHEHGIIHRDLKPANIKLREDGTVKVLDFGLAKALSHETTASANLSMSPTITSPALMTGSGVILGTAAYMSPEQARGKAVDKRTDIWAFGCVLYEMLSGRRAFEGEEVSDTLAAILRAEPQWNALPDRLAVEVRTLLDHCLQKDLRERLGSMSTVTFLLRQVNASKKGVPIDTPRKISPRTVAAALLAAMIVATAAAAIAWHYKPPPAQVVSRFSLMLPDGQRFTINSRQVLAVSPDGTQIAYVAARRLFVRPLSQLDPKRVTGADEGTVSNPVFAPDGRTIAYFTDAGGGTLRKVAINGGSAVTLCRVESPSGMSWGPTGIVFDQPTGIFRVPDIGGRPELLIATKQGEFVQGPQVLPDGDHVLFTLAKGESTDRWDKATILVQSLATGERKILVEGGTDARLLSSNHLVYAVNGVVFALPFDPQRLATRGGPEPVIEGVARASVTNSGIAKFAVSSTGSLFYQPGPVAGVSGDLDLAWIDRNGHAEPLHLPPSTYASPRISRNGRFVAVGVQNTQDTSIAIVDLAQTNAPRRLTFGANSRFPVWAPDERRVAFQSDREGDSAIFWQKADGTDVAERLTKPEQRSIHIPYSFSPDGKHLLFGVLKSGRASLWVLSLFDRRASPFGGVESNYQPNAEFSPDGRWIAYTSGETQGAQNVYVQPFPATGTKYQISRPETAGANAMWAPDGSELFYGRGPGEQVVAKVTTGPTFTFGPPVPVASGSRQTRGLAAPRDFDISRDGKNILGIIRVGVTESNADEIRVVLNWFEELKQRVPIK